MTTTRWISELPDQRPSHALPARPQVHHPFVWYVAAGIVTTGLQTLLFLATRSSFGSVVANLFAITVTTLLNTEFHRRITFAGYTSKPARVYLQSLLTFAFYATYGSIVLILLKAIVNQPSANLEAGILMLASFTGGLGRFALLKWWVFTRKEDSADSPTAIR